MGRAAPDRASEDAVARGEPREQPGARRDEQTARRRRLECALGVPFTEGNEITVLRNGDRIFPAMLDAIEAAEQTVDLVTFVYWSGEIARRFAHALGRKAEQGVRVRVLLDGVGSLPMSDELEDHMARRGVLVRTFRPPALLRPWRLDHRTHRKILVCDGRVGFTGGVGIAAEWEGDARHPGEWRETHVRVVGPALDGLWAGFAGNWMEVVRALDVHEWQPRARPAGDAAVLVLRSTAAVDWSDVALLFHLLVRSARERLRIATPYFVPDGASVELLCAAARSGVTVEIMTAGRHCDSRISQWAGRACYEQLLGCGVTLLSYDHTMLHSKVITVDGALACVGSPNFNHRSMKKDDELCLVIDDASVVAQLDADFDDDRRHCCRLDGDAWSRRGTLARLAERLAAAVRHEV